MRRFLYLVLPIAAIVLICCGQSVEDGAMNYYNRALHLYKCNEYNGAKLQLDSIKVLYPKAFETRGKAIRLMLRVEEAEQLRSIAYEDSVINLLQHRIELMKEGLDYIFDSRYQDIGYYISSRQLPESNIDIDYLRAQVDEKGRMTIVSSCSDAKPIHHRSIRVSANGVYVESNISDDYYEFKDLGRYYEKCNIYGGKEREIASFIQMYKEQGVRVELVGASREKSYILRLTDGEAISKIYNLSLALQSYGEHMEILSEAKRRVEFIRSRMKDTNE